MTHWAAAYIGTPWDAASQHCWAFVRRVWAERFSLQVPEVQIDAESPYAARRAFGRGQDGWQQVDTPREGDGVLMAKGARICHVGIWITPDPTPGVLHAIEHAGVIFTPLPRLGGIGYGLAGFYRRIA